MRLPAPTELLLLWLPMLAILRRLLLSLSAGLLDATCCKSHTIYFSPLSSCYHTDTEAWLRLKHGRQDTTLKEHGYAWRPCRRAATLKNARLSKLLCKVQKCKIQLAAHPAQGQAALAAEGLLRGC